MTFLHTLLLCDKLDFTTALVVCPLNTVLNWLNEFEKWQEGMKDEESLEVWGCFCHFSCCSYLSLVMLFYFVFLSMCQPPNLWLVFIDYYLSFVNQVTELATVKRPQERAYALQQWQENGGVMIIGYEMYRNLTQGRNIKSKKLKETFQKTLVDPGTIFCVNCKLNYVPVVLINCECEQKMCN